MFTGRTEACRAGRQNEYDAATTKVAKQQVNSKYGERFQLEPSWSGLIFDPYDTPYGPFHVLVLNCLCLRSCSLICLAATIFTSTIRLSLVLTTLTSEAIAELNAFRKTLRLPLHWGGTLEKLELHKLSNIFVNLNAMAPLTLSLFSPLWQLCRRNHHRMAHSRAIRCEVGSNIALDISDVAQILSHPPKRASGERYQTQCNACTQL
jgi:hypothetical protein